MSSGSGRSFVLSVIEMYKSKPCLWQITHPDYHSKNKRKDALNALLILFKKVMPSSNMETVKKKISSLRSAFKKELNKVKCSIKSGVPTDEIHVPKLWYYNELLFLADIRSPSDSAKVHSVLEDNSSGDEVSSDETDLDESESKPMITTPSSSFSQSSSKRKINDDHFLSKIAKKMDTSPPPPALPPPTKPQYAAYGEHVAERLRAMPALMATCCQKIINDAIFMAETNNLDITSYIRSNSFDSQMRQ